MSIHVKLVTPDRVLFEEEAASLTVPTETGEITILPNHVPLVANIVSGVAELKRTDGSIEDIALSNGFLQISTGSNVTMLAETAERGAELDIRTIEEAKARAERVMKEGVHATEESFAEATAALERELARYRAAIKYKKRSGHRPASHEIPSAE
jgi:F-type H+-transporting ATPase subunit epsilon